MKMCRWSNGIKCFHSIWRAKWFHTFILRDKQQYIQLTMEFENQLCLDAIFVCLVVSLSLLSNIMSLILTKLGTAHSTVQLSNKANTNTYAYYQYSQFCVWWTKFVYTRIIHRHLLDFVFIAFQSIVLFVYYQVISGKPILFTIDPMLSVFFFKCFTGFPFT